ncbi:MAG: hypothetical protein H7Z76_12275 [Methylotenera sp.]|nr:hypothetical protein [Flavobacterium sp.]
MEFEYSRIEHCFLLDNLKNEVIKKTLAYMLDFKEHDNLVVIPKPHSVEISNADICIAVILFSGFENEEYQQLLTKDNFHIVSFDTIVQTMAEFENMFIKHIDSLALFFMALARTDDTNIKDFLYLKNLCQNKTIFQLRKEYILKDVVWNQDLFSLLYKKTNNNQNSKKIKNQFATSMIVESVPETLAEVNIEKTNSSLIEKFVVNGAQMGVKAIESECGKKKPLFIGFAVAAGINRAKKAIMLALSTPLFNQLILENVKTILLHISSDSIEMTLEEIGEINDAIQERVGNNADTIMTVSVYKNLGKSLSITVMVSEFEIEGNS